jgi:glycosyltransferase involved in cell wall biosynthesis
VRCDANDRCTALCKQATGIELLYGLQPITLDLPPVLQVSRDTWKQFELRSGECIYKALNASSAAELVARPKVVLTARTFSIAEKDALFALSGALVHTSRGEGFGLIVAEAMAAGLPVITTDRGAVADFTSNHTAWLVPSTLVPCYDWHPCGRTGRPWSTFSRPMAQPPLWLDVRADDLGATMRHLLEMPELRARKAAAAREFVEEHLSWEGVYSIIQRRVDALLPEALATRASAPGT